MSHDEFLAQVLEEDAEGIEQLRIEEPTSTNMMTFLQWCLSGYSERIQQGRVGTVTEGTSVLQLTSTETEIAREFLGDIHSNYDWKADAQIQSVIVPAAYRACMVLGDTMKQLARLADARLGGHTMTCRPGGHV
ncbi:hypothetical protein R1flu_017003 [Riccia fluitans]|uniref:Uncharacterized protein n=1 Tax=Riccia fluitans TaxID=41844 RepID=A0ABD1YSE3_9MARC